MLDAADLPALLADAAEKGLARVPAPGERRAPPSEGDYGTSPGRTGEIRDELRVERVDGDRVRIARWILRPNAGWQLQEAPVMLPPDRFEQALDEPPRSAACWRRAIPWLLPARRIMSTKWTAESIPDQSGRTAVVTGANSGLGLVTARELARAGPTWSSPAGTWRRARRPAPRSLRPVPGAQLELEELDLSSLDSVRSFAGRFRDGHDGLDLLINNAGVMATPRRQTADGFELQFGTNHLGHFALTGLLIDTIEGRADGRVVTLSSTAHRTGRIAFDDLGGEKHYFRWRAYGQSKLANLLFALELDRRLRAAGSSVKSLAAHPGLRGHQPPARRAARRSTARSCGSRTGSWPRARRWAPCPSSTPPRSPGSRGAPTSGPTASASSAAIPSRSRPTRPPATRRWRGACGRSRRS